jgi:hypothetical protein
MKRDPAAAPDAPICAVVPLFTATMSVLPGKPVGVQLLPVNQLLSAALSVQILVGVWALNVADSIKFKLNPSRIIQQLGQ